MIYSYALQKIFLISVGLLFHLGKICTFHNIFSILSPFNFRNCVMYLFPQRIRNKKHHRYVLKNLSKCKCLQTTLKHEWYQFTSHRIRWKVRSPEMRRSVDYLYLQWKYRQSTDIPISGDLLFWRILHCDKVIDTSI